MITHLHIKNFKSLVDFDLPEEGHDLGKFVCLVGMNGSGKSTVLQALDFLAHLMEGDVSEWLERREWEMGDLASRISGMGLAVQRPSPLVPFALDVNLNGQRVCWEGLFDRRQKRCKVESVKLRGHVVMNHLQGRLEYEERGFHGPLTSEKTGTLNFEGSILSVHTKLPVPAVRDLRAFLLGLKSLELLSPSAMRRRSRRGEDIGHGGEQLSAFLDTLSAKSKASLLSDLRHFYPFLTRLDVSTVRGGWKKLGGWEQLGSTNFNISASHMNDGMLRVIAILAQAYSEHPVLLFDEIENGINPELVEKLVDFLVNLKNKQVIVTTHSPMILNYLEDKVAKESVYLLYRDKAGHTRSTRFFDIPEVGAKLEALGPGEVFADTNLTKLTQKLPKRRRDTTQRAA
ncbi:MAG: AAA family ATPase [Verrucomicrobiaceae bacterium]|nr:AAA family ATPase [Verrucomicrobiaceae bacterium]